MGDPPGKLPENDLTIQAQSGSDQAFEELVRLNQRSLYGMLYQLTGNVDDAMDLVQKSFIKAYTSIDRFRGEASFKTWIRKIALNTYRNHVRYEAKRRHQDIDTTPVRDPSDFQERMEGRQHKDMLWEEARNLPPRQLEALVLRVQEGHSFDEVARIMDCTTGSAKASYHHAVSKLKKGLERNLQGKELVRERPEGTKNEL